jgi:hypothetical protein
VIDQVMKNASCHDDKMEAYCNAVRAFEDRFYDIELNHVPRRYNEEADELTKIASGRIIVPLNVFARDVARPSVNLELAPLSEEEPSGAPSNPTGVEPMDEDPSNEVFVLSLLEGYGADELETMDADPPPTWRTGVTSTSLGWVEGRFPQTDPRLDALPGWLSRSPWSTVSCTSAPLQASCSFETFTRACAVTARRRALSWTTLSSRASIGPPRLLMPVRSCAPARGANFTLAKLTALLTPSRRSPSHGLLPCGGWTLSGPCERCPGATPPTGRHRQVLQVGRGALDHKS